MINRATVVPTFVIALTLVGFGPVPPLDRGAQVVQPGATPTSTQQPDFDPMTAAAIAIIVHANAMAAGAEALDQEALRTGDMALTELADHWRADAEAIRDRGVWMLLSQSAGSMVHDPDTAHQLDLRSLRANGETMIVEGDLMIAHGQEMATQISELRDAGVLEPELADQLTAIADEIVATGERIAKDGKEMRDYAKRILESLGE